MATWSMKGARSRSGRCRNTSKAQPQPFSTSCGARAMLMSESAASSVSVVGIGSGGGGIGVRAELGAMRIRHGGEKFNWRGAKSGWAILCGTQFWRMVGGFSSGALPHPQNTTPKKRHPKNWKGGASMPRSFMLYQVVEGWGVSLRSLYRCCWT